MIPEYELRTLATSIADAFDLAARGSPAAGDLLIQQGFMEARRRAAGAPWEADLVTLWQQVADAYRERLDSSRRE